jgi:1-acyl-sn-glycerol-3-phosphate acyltransferase
VSEDMDIAYPRKRILRSLARFTGKVVLPIAFRVEITGIENFPPSGPLILVGNHTAIMETVLLVVYPPRQVEVLGSTDVPHEWFTNLITKFYGYIPYRRGHMDRPALRQALSVLNQKGVLGIFPEGGIWQLSERRVQSGVAWLSYHSQSPVLPIYFGGTKGALQAATMLKRPLLTMKIGQTIPCAKLPIGAVHKDYYKAYATQVMNAVEALRSEHKETPSRNIRDEQYKLEVSIFQQNGKAYSIPEEMVIKNGQALAKLLLYPTILKIFKSNLRLPIHALQTLATRPDARSIASACDLIIDYLDKANPYLLTYRFGQREGHAMQLGLKELKMLAQWADRNKNNIHINPIHQYFDVVKGVEVSNSDQGTFKNWM